MYQGALLELATARPDWEDQPHRPVMVSPPPPHSPGRWVELFAHPSRVFGERDGRVYYRVVWLGASFEAMGRTTTRCARGTVRADVRYHPRRFYLDGCFCDKGKARFTCNLSRER